MSNKKLGNDFEAQFCEILFEEGFWCHNLAQNQAGQPADVIAVRNGKAYLIDCKVCSNGKFALSRMEDNQDLAMELWRRCGNGDGWFAIRLEDKSIYMIPHYIIKAMLKKNKSDMSEFEITMNGYTILEWIG